MKRKILCMEFMTDGGDVIPQLTKDGCNPDFVMAALHFLDCGHKIVLSVHEVESDKG